MMQSVGKVFVDSVDIFLTLIQNKSEDQLLDTLTVNTETMMGSLVTKRCKA